LFLQIFITAILLVILGKSQWVSSYAYFHLLGIVEGFAMKLIPALSFLSGDQQVRRPPLISLHGSAGLS